MFYFLSSTLIFLSVGIIEILFLVLPPDLSAEKTRYATGVVLSNYALLAWITGLAMALTEWALLVVFPNRVRQLLLRRLFLALLLFVILGAYGSMLVGELLGLHLSFLHPGRLLGALIVAPLAWAAAGRLMSLWPPIPKPQSRNGAIRLVLNLVFIVGIPAAAVPYILQDRVLREAWGGEVKNATWRGESKPWNGPPESLSLLLLTLDTLRADHLPPYGNSFVWAPNIARLAREGTLFTKAFTVTPNTAPAHSSLFTGAYPEEHGVRHNGQILKPGLPTLAEHLAKRSYHTAGFVSTPLLSRQFGFDRGFQYFDDTITNPGKIFKDSELSFLLRLRRKLGYHAAPVYPTRDAGPAVDGFGEWLQNVGDERFFAWVHFFDVHHPYSPPLRYYSGRYHPGVSTITQLKSGVLANLPFRYDGEIAYVDRVIGTVMNELHRRNRLENTLVLLTSDHGEGLGEHGYLEHGYRLYDEQLHIPIIAWRPGYLKSGHRERTLVEIQDLFPTVLDLLGHRDLARSSLSGRSVAITALRETRTQLTEPYRKRERAYAETMGPSREAPLFSLRDSRWKLIMVHDTLQLELYDMEQDPDELQNLAKLRPDIAHSLLAELNRRIRLNQGDRFEPEGDIFELLKSLGYVE